MPLFFDYFLCINFIAGMPVIDDKANAVYSMGAAEFAKHMKVLVENGASIIGGCCGTTPEYIKAVAQELGIEIY